jgi:hypothetical protein
MALNHGLFREVDPKHGPVGITFRGLRDRFIPATQPGEGGFQRIMKLLQISKDICSEYPGHIVICCRTSAPIVSPPPISARLGAYSKAGAVPILSSGPAEASGKQERTTDSLPGRGYIAGTARTNARTCRRIRRYEPCCVSADGPTAIVETGGACTHIGCLSYGP